MGVLLINAGPDVSLDLHLKPLQNGSVPDFLVQRGLLLLAFIRALVLWEMLHTVAWEIFIRARGCTWYTFFIRGLYYAILNAHCCTMLRWIILPSIHLLLIERGQRLDHEKHVCEKRFQIVSYHVLLILIVNFYRHTLIRILKFLLYERKVLLTWEWAQSNLIHNCLELIFEWFFCVWVYKGPLIDDICDLLV